MVYFGIAGGGLASAVYRTQIAINIAATFLLGSVALIVAVLSVRWRSPEDLDSNIKVGLILSTLLLLVCCAELLLQVHRTWSLQKTYHWVKWVESIFGSVLATIPFVVFLVLKGQSLTGDSDRKP